MSPDDPRLRNLKPFPKGISGNPAGLPKGYVRASTIINKLLNGKMIIEQAGKKLKKSRMEVILIKAVADSINDRNSANERTKARESIFNRVEGKTVQPIGTAPEPEVNIILSPMESKFIDKI